MAPFKSAILKSAPLRFVSFIVALKKLLFFKLAMSNRDQERLASWKEPFSIIAFSNLARVRLLFLKFPPLKSQLLKLASDKLFVSANNMVGENDTCFSVVRYGNVVGSRGSVVPYFNKLIDSGQEYLPITHTDMTRFWITLRDGVEFVLKNFYRMRGGEIFVPKIPSARIIDLATAMAPNLKQEIIGIRPGEKIHEIMCPEDDSHLTLEFGDHYVIQPSITFTSRGNNYKENKLGEIGTPVEAGFLYSSGVNSHFLTIKELIKYNSISEL